LNRNKRSTDKKRVYILGVVILGIVLLAIITISGASMPASASNQTTNASTEPSVFSAEPSKTPEIAYISVSELPETPSPSPSEEPSPTPEPRYGFTDDDIYLLAQLLCGSKNVSGDGEFDIDFAKTVNYFEVSKVLSVVMNRVRSDKFPDTVYDVVMQKNPRQFAVMPANSKKTPSDIALKTVRDWCEAYDRFDPGVQVCPEAHLYFSGNGRINITR